MTNDLARRIWEHKHDLVKGFSQRYGVHRLVHYEVFDSIREAITREKRLKAWKRSWKLQLISENNPDWDDLYEPISNASGSLLSQG